MIIGEGGQFYVPFAPFPAVALMPIVALVGPETADQWESGINALLAAAVVGLGWWLTGRIAVRSLWDRAWLVALLGFSTQILWITTRGGVWHTGHLIATLLTLGCLIELWGKRRAWLIGLMAGAAFLTRAPLAFAVPFYGLMLLPEAWWGTARDNVRAAIERVPWRAWFGLAAGVLPAIALFFLYNQVRFGTPLESGYALATLPPFLEEQRQKGLFALAHVPMNLDYLFLHLPALDDDFPFFMPDGLGMSVLLTTPGLLYAVRADWRRPWSWLLLGRGHPRADPDASLLRRGMAAVRLPLLPRLDPVRLGAVRDGGGVPRPDLVALASGVPGRALRHGLRAVLGVSAVRRAVTLLRCPS